MPKKQPALRYADPRDPLDPLAWVDPSTIASASELKREPLQQTGYTVIDEPKLSLLISHTVEHQAAGWHAIGGIFVSKYNDGTATYYQAMVHYG